MSLFGWLFGKRRAAPQVASLSATEVLTKLKGAALPCLRLRAGDGGRSWLGGRPQMASPWPRFQGRPLSLVAQIDLAQARAAGGPNWLPSEGQLLFFYDLETGGWGMEAEEAGSSVVIYEPRRAEVAPPPDDLPEDARFDQRPLRFDLDVSMPDDPERLGLNLKDMSSTECRRLEAELEAMAPASPAHQIGGYPTPVQWDDMERTCERVAPREGRRPGAGVDEWRLLLQVDSDDDAGMMWCDVGQLYFWVREVDARAGDFSRTWTILQSH
ncbi:YwqG family protein [Phenylobacterium sp.]|uniref:YwqG family protein n=1 Tax=Phenylobacterium sp. TaxID=1871053 RepID=UPI0025FE4F77|nr:YwqG family protein [Phenylobacterium sp.]